MTTKLNEEARHVLQCLVDGSALFQDAEWKWYIGGERVSDAVACIMWTEQWIAASQYWKSWDITDAGRAALAQGDGHD